MTVIITTWVEDLTVEGDIFGCPERSKRGERQVKMMGMRAITQGYRMGKRKKTPPMLNIRIMILM